MRNRWVLIGLLILATVLVDLVVWSIVLSDSGPSPPPAALVEVARLVLPSLACAQVSLVAIWVALGGTSLPWRLVGLIVVVASWVGLVAVARSAAAPEKFFETYGTVFLLSDAIAVLGPVAVARFAGVRLGTTTEILSTPDPLANRGRWQFSLGYLFSWLTAVAVTLGLLKWTIDYQVVPSLLAQWDEMTVASVGSAAIALVALWTALGTRRPALRIGLLGVTTVTAIAFYRLLGGLHLWLPAVLICLVQVFWLLASLGVCRVAGYRIVFRSPVGP